MTHCPVASAVGQCLAPLAPQLLTRSVAAQSHRKWGGAGTWALGLLSRSKGAKGQEKKQNTNTCTDRSEHAEEQMGADHHRTSKVASANAALGDRKS